MLARRRTGCHCPRTRPLEELSHRVGHIPHGLPPKAYRSLLDGGNLPPPILDKNSSKGIRDDVELLALPGRGPPVAVVPAVVEGEAEYGEDHERTLEEELELLMEQDERNEEWCDSDDVFSDEHGDEVDIDPPPVAVPVVVAKGKAKGKAKVTAKAKAKGKAGDAVPHTKHTAFTLDVRKDGMGLSTLRHDTVRRKLAAHCGHALHGKRCRMQRQLNRRLTNPAGA